MLDQRFAIAGDGLKWMFWGEILALFVIVPWIGTLAVVAGSVISIIGLVKTLRADRGYQRALVMLGLMVAVNILSLAAALLSAVGTVFGGVGAVFSGTVLLTVLGVAGTVFSFLRTYFVCTATSGLLRELGWDRDAYLGDLVWKLTAVCSLVSILLNLISFVSLSAAGFLDLFISLLSLAAGIVYLVFLYRSYHRLLS